jgi:hypothetical protein
MKFLLIGILIVLVLPYLVQFLIKFKSKGDSDFLKPLGGSFSSGFSIFN